MSRRSQGLDVFQKLRIDGHEIFEMPVLGAILDHPDLTVALDDLRFDLADLFIDEGRDLAIAAQDLLAGLDHTIRTKRIGLAREAERRLRLLPGFEDRLIGPFRDERFAGLELVDRLDGVERAGSDVGQSFFKIFYRSHDYSSPKIITSMIKLNFRFLIRLIQGDRRLYPYMS